MQLPSFPLDQWIEQKNYADPPIEYDLASSTGPVWTLRELLALSPKDDLESLFDTRLLYTSAAGTAELRSAIAALEETDPDHVQIVTGASEALFILFFLAAEPNSNVVLPRPGFPSNAAVAQSLGIEIRYYTLRAQDDFRVDLDEIRRLADHNTRFVLVNSPHNPTGSVLSDEEMETLHDFCAERGVQFVSDEVYHPIYHGPSTRSAARLPHATVVSDFSKALCLSGLRIGWIVDHDPARRKSYHDARNYLTITNTILGEKLGALALRHADAVYGRARKIAARNLALLDRLFAEHTDLMRWSRPKGGMTAFPALAGGVDGRDFCTRLMKRGVLMVPGDCFGEPSSFRLGFAASGDKFPKALERFAGFLDECRAGSRAANAQLVSVRK